MVPFELFSFSSHASSGKIGTSAYQRSANRQEAYHVKVAWVIAHVGVYSCVPDHTPQRHGMTDSAPIIPECPNRQECRRKNEDVCAHECVHNRMIPAHLNSKKKSRPAGAGFDSTLLNRVKQTLRSPSPLRSLIIPIPR